MTIAAMAPLMRVARSRIQFAVPTLIGEESEHL